MKTVLCGAALVLLVVVPSPADDDGQQIEFFFPSDPGFTVLEYHWGRYSGVPLLRVSGDGTVRAYQENASYVGDLALLDKRTLVPAGTHTIQDSFLDLNELVRSLLETGLLTFNEDLLQARLKDARRAEHDKTGKIHMTSEVGVHQIRLRFQELSSSPEDEPDKDYERTIRWREGGLSLDRAVELYPEIVELRQFLDAVTVLWNLHKQTIESWSGE